MCGVVRIADGLANPAAAGNLVAVCVRPLANLCELVGVAALGGAATAAAALAAAADPAGGGNVVGERHAQRVSVVVGEVNLVVVSIKRKGHGTALISLGQALRP